MHRLMGHALADLVPPDSAHVDYTCLPRLPIAWPLQDFQLLGRCRACATQHISSSDVFSNTSACIGIQANLAQGHPLYIYIYIPNSIVPIGIKPADGRCAGRRRLQAYIHTAGGRSADGRPSRIGLRKHSAWATPLYIYILKSAALGKWTAEWNNIRYIYIYTYIYI